MKVHLGTFADSKFGLAISFKKNHISPSSSASCFLGLLFAQTLNSGSELVHSGKGEAVWECHAQCALAEQGRQCGDGDGMAVWGFGGRDLDRACRVLRPAWFSAGYRCMLGKGVFILMYLFIFSKACAPFSLNLCVFLI